MKRHSIKYLIAATLAAAMNAASVPVAHAEDMDLFVSSTTSGAGNPNIIIVIDNSANWSAANQGWAGGVKQGQAELRSLRTLVGELSDNVNVGLMMMTGGTGGAANGAYVRFHVSPMTAANKAALQELIGDDTCIDGTNTLTGTPKCIYKNFDSSTEKISTSSSDYSRSMFEVFKYLGGYTSPAHSTDDVAGTPVDTTAGVGATHFGPIRYSGNPDPKIDQRAFVNGSGGSRTTYNPVVGAATACGKNYVILIGNGFPSGDDTNGALLAGVGGSTTQLSMPTYTTIASGTTVNLGTDSACYASTTACATAAATLFPAFQGYPVTSQSCVTQTGTNATTTTGCPTGQTKNYLVKGVLSQVADIPTGSSAVPATNKTRYADEWAKFLFTTDVGSPLGRQFAQVFTLDVFKNQPDTDQSALLASMAKFGGGKYFQATTESAILDALRSVVIEIQSLNSVFAAASLPISASNRSQNENQVFIGMFRPDSGARPRWYGNLKLYKIRDFNGGPKLADMNNLEAVSDTTGFIKACATSFWTADTSNYWEYAGTAGTCTTSSFNKFSDSPDGGLVEKGGAAEMVRLGNNPTATSTTPTYAVNRSVYTCTGTSGCNISPTAMHLFNTTNVSAAQLGVSTDIEQTAIVNYTLGQDVDAENSISISGDPTVDVRGAVHGDVAHSRPLPVNYGGTTGVVVYYGTNDGGFRAVRASDGKELWSFIAPEHHSKLKRLRDNSPLIAYPGVSATLSPTPQKKDYFFDGSTGIYETFTASDTADKAWVFPSMRRGGRMLYGFDVSSPTSPRMMWRVGCPNLTNDTGCGSDYTQMGQTWSFPNAAFIKGFSSTDPVIVMGGGYDSCEDTDSSAPSCGSTKGNRVYVINAATGALLKAFTTDRAVSADVTLLDRDFDGNIDHAYIADMGGNLYRVDFVNPTTLATRASTAWTMTKIARTTGAGRKFLNAPAVLPVTGKVFVTVTSGDRERPLITNYPFSEAIQNRAYMYIDTFTTSGLPVNLDGDTMNDFTTATSCTTTFAPDKPDGWFFDLVAGRGEQGVTPSIIFGGLIFFSTNRPLTGSAASCSNNLGEARGYAVNLLNASGGVNTAGVCDGNRSGVFTGGGLPTNPGVSTPNVDGKDETVCMGCINRDTGTGSQLNPFKPKLSISQKRSRIYWYKQGDK